MESYDHDEKAESRKGRRGICTPWKGPRKCSHLLPILLLICTALLFGVCRLIDNNTNISYGLKAASPGAAVKRSAKCSTHLLRDLELYHAYTRKHADLKMKLLSEQDGAPPLQSEHSRRPREITIITQMSVERWPHLEKMATSWGGPLCVVVHVKRRADIAAVHGKLKRVHERIEAQRHCRLHLQMVMEEGFKSKKDALAASYPVNAMRNVGLSMATTDLVFLLDVDFVPSPGLHEKWTVNEKVYSELVSRTKYEGQLLVVPAFQPGILSGNLEPVEEPIPQSIEELRERWASGNITAFRPTRGIAHGSTGYGHFVHPLTTKPYPVVYRELYEPYVVAARAVIPKFDERFRGYGKNKIAHLYNCAVLGFSFVVLPEVYVWEIPHPRTEMYQTFRREKEDPCKKNIMNVAYDMFKMELQTKMQARSRQKTQQHREVFQDGIPQTDQDHSYDHQPKGHATFSKRKFI